MDKNTELTLAILRQNERFIRLKRRLITRGIPEVDAEEDAAHWIFINAKFDVAAA